MHLRQIMAHPRVTANPDELDGKLVLCAIRQPDLGYSLMRGTYIAGAGSYQGAGQPLFERMSDPAGHTTNCHERTR